MSVLASDFGTGQVFLSMLWFFLFFIWIWLLIMVFSDIFRSHDLSGGLKAIWTIFVVFMPYLGVFVYLLARGGKMHEHAVEAAQAQDAGDTRVHPERGDHRLERDRPARAAREPEGAGRHRRRRVPEDEGEGRRQLAPRRTHRAFVRPGNPPSFPGRSVFKPDFQVFARLYG